MDNRTPNAGHTTWGTGLGKIHLRHAITGCCVGCKKKIANWGGQIAETEMTVEQVKNTDFGLCSFVSDFWLDRLTSE